jgi:choline-sulfatase
MKRTTLILTALLLASLHLTAAPAKQTPNILFIITDQQHAGMLSCAGNPYLKTPMMDSLAATGARFERAYCANPVCMPSRISMMTGVLPSRVGVETNGKGRAKVTPDILEHSLGRVFAKAGYDTVYGGKVHLPMSLEDIGFKNIEANGGPRLAEAGAKFLRQSHDRPFLMVASFINPHDICLMAIEDTKHPGKITGPKPLIEAMALPPGMSRDEFFAHVCPPLPANFEIPEGEPEAILAADPADFRTHARNKWTQEQWRLYRWAYARPADGARGRGDRLDSDGIA